jgi:parvulin-like peptidyl-prolyl isomerase
MPLRKSSLVALSAVVLALLVSCGHGKAAGPSAAATVASTQITNDQVAREAKVLTFLSALSQQQCGDTSTGVAADVACNRSALSILIQGALIQKYADDNHIGVDPNDTAALVASLDSQAGKDKVDAGLSAQGLSRDDLNGFAEQLQLGRQVQQLLGEAALGEEKLRSLYQEQILTFTTLQVEQILVKTQTQAEQVYQQATAPGFTEAQFKALAKQVSTDPTVKQNSGEYPAAPASQYVTPFAKAAAALEPEEISRPVHSKFGWHVIRLVSKQVTPYDEAKAKLTLPQDQVGSFDDWLRTQAGALGVSVNPSFGMFDVKTLAVVAITSTNPSDTATPSATASAVAPPSQ